MPVRITVIHLNSTTFSPVTNNAKLILTAMFKFSILICLPAILCGCMLGYTWVNPDYSEDEMRGQFFVDKGECMGRAGRLYQDPEPVQDPDELYRECMRDIEREERYPVRTEDGNIEYRTVTRRTNPWQCRPSRELETAFREYQSELRTQQMGRARYVNTCLATFGWERVKKD
jgi:hypothetical protein